MNKKILIPIVIVVVILGAYFIVNSSNKNSTSGDLKIGTKVGNLAPDFTIQTIDGQTISLSNFKGKKALLITSTASWCSTCVIEANNIAPVYKEFNDEVEFLSISVDPSDTNTKLKVFQSSTDSPWFYSHPNLEGVQNMIIDYRLTRFEITYVIDKNGIIQFKDRRITEEEELKNILSKI